MDVLVLIDKLDDTVHNAKPVPLTDQVRVDKEEIYDILDQMRATIPEEIKQARWIVKERQEMLAEAKREAERIVKEARERQNQLNRKMAPDIESIYMMSSPQYSFLSSSGVKELAMFGGDLTDLVPPAVATRLEEALKRRRN
jgi:hypothetical protein